ncbi:phage tail protein [Chloroflexales bacterium ZM16-3]|nr:phage tail protein [Chloroflexales bacterium ZM16-3]
MPDTTDPFRSQVFYIEFEPYFKGAVLKVSGLSYEREVKQISQSVKDGKIIFCQLPGKYKPGTITITKAVTADKGLWDWRQKVTEVQNMGDVRVNGSITVYDTSNGNATLVWNVLKAWPSQIKGPTINISADVAEEEIELCYEELMQVEG